MPPRRGIAISLSLPEADTNGVPGTHSGSDGKRVFLKRGGKETRLLHSEE